MMVPLLFLLLSPAIPFAGAQSNTGPTDPYYNSFSPSIAIIVVVLVAALFLIGFFSIYIRQCSQSPNHGNTLAARSRRHPRGLDPSVIDSFPTLDYSAVKIHQIGKGALECAICLNEFQDSETLRLIPKCDHVFHPDCIDEWLASHTTCPVCRANLLPQPTDSLLNNADSSSDIEAAQNDAVSEQEAVEESDVMRLNRNRTKRSRSNKARRFPRSHSTGHSLVQPGESTDRFTLRLPEGVRNQIVNNQKFHRSTSLVILPTESSSRRGYRGDGSNRGRFSRRLDRGFNKSDDRWVFTMAPPFLVRASSVRSPRVASTTAAAGEETSADPIMPASAVDSARPPV